jgi:hypothetical protein
MSVIFIHLFYSGVFMGLQVIYKVYTKEKETDLFKI